MTMDVLAKVLRLGSDENDKTQHISGFGEIRIYNSLSDKQSRGTQSSARGPRFPRPFQFALLPSPGVSSLVVLAAGRRKGQRGE